MRDDLQAELVLSLVTTPERASATIGDLLEEKPRRGTTWFRLSAVRAAAGCVWRDLTAAPLKMAGAAAMGWLGYMLIALLLLMVGHLLAHAAWAILYVLTNHTGVELLSDVVRLRFEWDAIPPSVLRFIDLAGMMVVAPFYTGQILTTQWRERAIAFSFVLTFVWSLMLTVAPIAGMFGDRVTLAHLPAVAFFIVVGVIRMRVSQIHEPRRTGTTNA